MLTVEKQVKTQDAAEAAKQKAALYGDKADCCGCGACAACCGRGVISMEADGEGFLYPRVTAPSRCVGCGRCDAVCPVQHADEIHSQFTAAYAGWCTDGSAVRSASGGAAYALAKLVLSMGGVVYGVRYTDDCRAAVYTRAETEAALAATRTSKYIQAIKGDVYLQVKADLDAERRVLFVGLPCDTYAMKRFVGAGCGDLLVTVSLICHGPTSAAVHSAYLAALEKKYQSAATEINVRYKKDGHWKPYYIRARFASGAESLQKFQATDYDAAFQQFKRPSCSACRFRGDKFAADLLIGDFHSVEKGTALYHEEGVSSLLPLTPAGEAMLMQLGDSFVLHKADLARSISQRAVHSSVRATIDRAAFVSALRTGGLHAACRTPDMRRQKWETKKRRAVFSVKRGVYRILKRLRIVR